MTAVAQRVDDVRRRLIEHAHRDLLRQSVRAHGWDRADIIEALLVLGGDWQKLEQIYKDFQQRADAKILKDRDEGVPYGKSFARYVRFRTNICRHDCRCALCQTVFK